MTKQEYLNNIKNHICDVLKKNDIYRMEILFYGENQKATAEINCFAIDDENPIVSADFIVDDDHPEFLIVTNPPSFKVSEEVKEVVEEKAFNWKE